MDADRRPRLALDIAIMRLLRPLVRVLLRHAVPYSAFEDLAKRVYVETALTDFAIPGKKPSISRASILTGLTRKDVQRLLADPADGNAEVGERYNRAARVLTGWVRDPDFLDADGAPRALTGEGALSFGALVRRHSGDMPTRAVLDELLRVGAVRLRDDGLYEPIARAYVPQQGTLDKLNILGTDVADLIDTIDHNLQHGADDPRFQRKVMYHSIDVQALPAFRKLSAAQAQALLEKLDRWLAANDTDPAPADDAPRAERARVGLGIYYFEERLTPPSPSSSDKES
ncbi:MAG: DUF6502 family protein [Burkholderiaceae bacterium]